MQLRYGTDKIFILREDFKGTKPYIPSKGVNYKEPK